MEFQSQADDPYSLPMVPNTEPIVYTLDETEFFRKRDLLQKIKVVVGFDLVPQVDGQLPQYSELSRGNQFKFKNQCTKIFEVCINSEEETALINSRFNEIIGTVILSAGVPVENFRVMKNPGPQ